MRHGRSGRQLGLPRAEVPDWHGPLLHRTERARQRLHAVPLRRPTALHPQHPLCLQRPHAGSERRSVGQDRGAEYQLHALHAGALHQGLQRRVHRHEGHAPRGFHRYPGPPLRRRQEETRRLRHHPRHPLGRGADDRLRQEEARCLRDHRRQPLESGTDDPRAGGRPRQRRPAR